LPQRVFGCACGGADIDVETLADDYEVIVYVQTDQWYIQPFASDFRHSVDANGYFNAYAHEGDRVHVFLARAGLNWSTQAASLPVVGGEIIAEWDSAREACDDADLCTNDTWDAVTGCVFTAVDCDDDDVCTDEDCDPETGGCVYTDVDCDDGDLCTDDTCDPATGCVHTAVVCLTGQQCDPATGECVCDEDCLLTGYEPTEMSDVTVTVDTTKDPTLTITWPVRGGVGGVPAAPQGDYVLQMTWTGEADRKVEIRHDWAGSTFDLAPNSEIRADVYLATASALPGIVGIWDDVFGWLEGYPVPATTDEWVTIELSIGDVGYMSLDHIFALLFENLAGEAGTIYVDNLRLVGEDNSRQVDFSGRKWAVKSGNNRGPGPNNFADGDEDVWVDEEGRLHLTISQRDGAWYCSEIVAAESRGHGSYAFTVESRLDSLNENVVLGLFTWDGYAPDNNYREIDFEFGRWGEVVNDNAQFVIQPWDTAGNLHRFNIDYAGATEKTTHVMAWRADAIEFVSYFGELSATPAPDNILATWTYTGADNPPSGEGHVRMNLWLVNGMPPSDGQDVEVVVSSFEYQPESAITN